jgi:hypothetical protein
MALTTAGAALTTAHRAQQLALRARSIQGLVSLWRGVDPTRLGDTIDVFTQAAALLAQRGHSDSADIASRYFESFRTAERVSGRAAAVIARPPAATIVTNDLRGAALKGIIDGRRAGMTVDAAGRNGLVRVVGAFTKLVLGGGRMTVIGSIQADRKALGWTRVTSGEPCAFCRMLSGRGPAYKTEKSADFQPHDHCACTPEPIYRGSALDLGPVVQAAQHRQEYDDAQAWARESGTMSQDTSNNALNNYRRYLAAGKPEVGNDGSNPG